MYEVTIEPTGEVIEVEEGQTILAAALRQGVFLPFACGHGTCATCKCTIVDGYVEHGDASPFALMDIERDEGKFLACCATPETDLIIEANIDVDQDFKGYLVDDFRATVVSRAALSPTILGISLKLDRPMQFQAGQYINVTLPGVDGSRAFSIANPPSQAEHIDLHVRKVPGGAATSYLHDSLQIGESIDISGPYGQFFIRTSDTKDIIMIAGGSGLSSPESMLRDLLESNDQRQIYLFQGARNVAELYHADEMNALANEHANFHYIPALNEPAPDDHWNGFTGFVHEAAEHYFDGKFAGHKAYLCGPPPMIDAAINSLMKGRLFESDIHMEKFLTAADGKNEITRSALFKRI